MRRGGEERRGEEVYRNLQSVPTILARIEALNLNKMQNGAQFQPYINQNR